MVFLFGVSTIYDNVTLSIIHSGRSLQSLYDSSVPLVGSWRSSSQTPLPKPYPPSLSPSAWSRNPQQWESLLYIIILRQGEETFLICNRSSLTMAVAESQICLFST